jgi:hypothetical protein
MPTKARIGKEHQRRRGRADPLVPLIGERLRAGLSLSGLTNREAARRLGITPQLLEYYLSRHHTRCRARVRRALSKLTDLPEAWLAGDMRSLPWVQERWEDLQGVAWPALRSLLYQLRALTWVESKALASEALGETRRALAQLEGIFGPGWLPRHLTGPPPPPVAELLGVLRELASWPDRLGALREQAARARSRLQAVERAWAIRASDRPSVAQVVQYRLIGRCWQAWVRDARLRFPRFDPQQSSEPDVVEAASGVSVRLPAPWQEWFGIEHRLHQLLSLANWRSVMIGQVPPPGDPAEETAAVPVLGRVIEIALGPWLTGATTQPPALLLPGAHLDR